MYTCVSCAQHNKLFQYWRTPDTEISSPCISFSAPADACWHNRPFKWKPRDKQQLSWDCCGVVPIAALLFILLQMLLPACAVQALDTTSVINQTLCNSWELQHKPLSLCSHSFFARKLRVEMLHLRSSSVGGKAVGSGSAGSVHSLFLAKLSGFAGVKLSGDPVF